MAYKGFVGSGTVGHFLTTTDLQTRFPADLYAGRMATVEVVAGSATHYFSDGLTWKSHPLTVVDSNNNPIGFGVGGATLPSKYYYGMIASRCEPPNVLTGANKQMMSRSMHVAMDDLVSLQLVFANWYTNAASGELLPGAASSVTASVEYPIGTITQATYSGAVTGTAADGVNLVSDAIAVTIPRGAKFAVRMWHNNASGILYQNGWGLNTVSGSTPVSGEWVQFGVTTPDLTNSTTNSNNLQTAVSFRPAAIIGWTKEDSWAELGDSRIACGVTYDSTPSGYGLIGEVDRSLGRSFATLKLGRAGETAVQAAASSATRRIALASYCSKVVLNYGINDCVAGTAAATTITNLSTIAGKFGGKPVYICTVTPKSASSDSWTTTANQTTDATANPLRVTLNNLMRAGTFPPSITGYFEVTDPVEDIRDNGKWKATGVAFGYTPDGLHGNGAGNYLIEASTAFSPAYSS